jgi:hypothetical protein
MVGDETDWHDNNITNAPLLVARRKVIAHIGLKPRLLRRTAPALVHEFPMEVPGTNTATQSFDN